MSDNMPDNMPNKSSIRSSMLTQRRTFGRTLSDAQYLDHGKQLQSTFVGHFNWSDPKIIAGYWPLREEIDCRPLLYYLIKQNHSLCLPRVQTQSKVLEFNLWTPDTQLKKGSFGFKVPVQQDTSVIPDIFLVPFIAFDPKGHRVGYGYGHYDYTLEKLRHKKEILVIGLGYSIQKVDQIPFEPTDHPMDWVVTENEVIKVKDE